MKIAIYHGFDIIHFEMLGYLIEYFLKSKINIDIYAPLTNIINNEWRDYYDYLFKTLIVWHNPLLFNPEDYDLIFLLTDDDLSFKEDWLIKYGNDKVIMIDHSGKIRRNNAFYRIGTRFFSFRPECSWALPCYYGIDKKDKLKYLENSDKINIMCIGIQNRPPSVDFLKKLILNFDETIIYIIARNLDLELYKNYNNIKCYIFCSTKLMFELIKSTHYILCFDNPNNSEPIANSMSGAIPKAFSYGCNLIIPNIWQRYYNFKSCIDYKIINDSPQESLTLTKNIPLDSIYDELYYFISHRNILIDNIIKIKFPNFNKNNLFLSLPSPNIIILDNFNYDLTLQFREIYSNILNIYHNNSYIYNINNLNYTKFQESFIRIFNNYDILQDINIISLRQFKDIIILEKEAINNIRNIINIYNKNKYCVYYTIEDKIIILPY